MEKLSKIRIAELRLVKLVDYEPDVGIFAWKDSGKVAGNLDVASGYRSIGSLGSKVYEHRLAFLCMGEDASGEVDHIDHDRSNNAFSNLRIVDRQNNSRNHSLRSNNSSGVVGVYKQVKKGEWTGRWESKITVDYKSISLGVYKEFDDAVEARKFAEEHYGFHENHGS